jgi:hypothetical protein
MQNLQYFCNDRRSGTMFITTDNNHSIRFILKKGVIVSLAYRIKYGNNALSLIKKGVSGAFAFKQNVFSGKDDKTLPETSQLLEILLNNEMPLASDHLNEASNEPPFFIENKIDIIKEELSFFIGPIGQFICDEYLDNYAEPTSHLELEKMLMVISKEIEDQDKEEQFRQRLIKLNISSNSDVIR